MASAAPDENLKRARLAREIAKAKSAQLEARKKELEVERLEVRAAQPVEVERNATAKDVCAHFGVKRSAITDWCKNRGAPYSKVGQAYRFNLDELGAWLSARGLARGKGGKRIGGEAAEIELKTRIANMRKTQAAAEKIELELAKLRGELLDAEEVDRGRLDRIAYAKAVLMGGPAALAPDVIRCESAAEAEDMLADWVYRALSELAGEELQVPEEDDCACRCHLL